MHQGFAAWWIHQSSITFAFKGSTNCHSNLTAYAPWCSSLDGPKRAGYRLPLGGSQTFILSRCNPLSTHLFLLKLPTPMCQVCLSPPSKPRSTATPALSMFSADPIYMSAPILIPFLWSICCFHFSLVAGYLLVPFLNNIKAWVLFLYVEDSMGI